MLADVRSVCPTCESLNLLYLLFCYKCKIGYYVKETDTKFDSIAIKYIKDNNNNLPVAVHFNQAFHGSNDIRCGISASLVKGQQERRRSELQYIFKIKTRIKKLIRYLIFLRE